MTDKQIIKKCVSLLKILRKDAEMAIKGDWDCSTSEGLEGFEAQIQLIDELLETIVENKIKELKS